MTKSKSSFSIGVFPYKDNHNYDGADGNFHHNDAKITNRNANIMSFE